MRGLRFFDRSGVSQPKEGLPGPFSFVPLPHGYHRLLDADIVREPLDWCQEQFGDPQPMKQGAEHGQRLEPGAWGFWPGGAVFFTETAQAMWFKLRWC